MALDTRLEIEDSFDEKPSRVDGYAERLIIADMVKEAKTKKLNETMDKYHRRHSRFQMLLMTMVAGGIYYLYEIGCWEMIKDFFISMSQ